ncbi:hypothetical protein BDV96DRAFT_302502 [Lophiotrema nucula]|uniref:Uncharacterized protein n=1 Tax=Lophiotrema nucula TaxID=690887 RepID=A0A6A5YLP3_9PLEO|nr:hypothetical protein BDV96DRAFT_302502 [Lophiotrema nucula]
MLPPVDPGVIESNPKFAILYKDLCTRKLNPDGSTRDTKKQRVHDEIRRNLNTARTSDTQIQILLSMLSDLPSKASELPPELHAVVEVVTAQLSGQIPDSDRNILAGDVDSFLENISTISAEISYQLITIAEHLCKIADPIKTPSISNLNEKAAFLQAQAMAELPESLAREREELANTAYKVLTLHRQVLETSIKILEQTMHGSLARATKAKAEHLGTRATSLGLQAKIYTLTHPPPKEFMEALKSFRVGLGTTEKELRDREGLARRALELYERAGEKGMRDIAKRAQHLRAEIGKTEAEIEKLERGE